MEKLRKSFTPRTKVFIFNNYQNPFGYSSQDAEIKGFPLSSLISVSKINFSRSEIAELCVKHNCWVLSDEAYFDLVFGTSALHSPFPLPTSLSPHKISNPIC
jgi:aspartate/methionine/tyrosine aminotransferase